MLSVLLLAAADPPVCRNPSHDRLIVQAGRDVCGPAVAPSGAPRAPGLLPTECPGPQHTYRIDVRGRADMCVKTVKTENRGI